VDSTFRTAAEAPADPLAGFLSASKDTSGNQILAEKQNKDTIYLSKELTGEPYAVKHFNLKNFWDSPTSDMKEEIQEVDDWVKQTAKERKLEDKPSSYKEVIDGILEQIGKSDNEEPSRTFERVSKAIQAHKRLAEAKLPPILNVASLTPDEYKKTRA
jgi:hypothetical protein